VCVNLSVYPLSLLGNGSVIMSLSLLGNGSVKIPLSLLGNGSVARKQLGEHVLAATNTHETIQELLDASISMHSVSYHRKVGD
jgi:hypothetical protein